MNQENEVDIPEVDVEKLVADQKAFFRSDQMPDPDQRIVILKALQKEIEDRQDDIAEALYRDFKKPKFETLLTETSFILSELKYLIKNLKKWAKPQKVKRSLLSYPSSDYIYPQPYGTCLVLAPWNYPFQLSVSPAIGAIAEGKTVVLKPSEYSPHTSAIIEDIFQAVFKPDHVQVVQGEVNVSQSLLKQKWDYVFFTGSIPVGRVVAQAIAPNLIPSTLELGGKSPCIVHRSAKIQLAAKRIVWGKFLNAGQTCIAPDYIVIDSCVKVDFVEALKKEISMAFGEDPQKSNSYSRIINRKNFERLEKYLQGEKILIGGETDSEDNYVAPTVLDEPTVDSQVMQEEIFGPILPVLSYSGEEELERILDIYPDPLALYVFSESKEFLEDLLKKRSFGGGAVNDVVIHIANKNLPFGGVGNSGYGAYHGRFSFDTFTHKKSISKRATWLDVPLPYAPYRNKLNYMSKILRMI